MNYEQIYVDVYGELQEASKKECFSEIENLINTTEPNDQKLYAELCEHFGLRVGASGFAVIEPGNTIKLAIISMTYATLAEDGKSYPIFFNQQRENFIIRHLEGNTFIFGGLDFLEKLDDELNEKFYNTFRSSRGVFLVDFYAICFLLECYLELEDIQIGISDYIQNSKTDKDALCNFSLTKVDLMQERGEPWDTLMGMLQKNRLDYCSFQSIKKGLMR